MADDSKSSDSSAESSYSVTKLRISTSQTPKTETKVIKKQKNVISVCLTNCRYEVVKKVVEKFQYKEVSEVENWNLYWTDLSITVERCKEMKRYQKINHFPGMLEICRKDLLARNLNRMLRLFPKEYSFFPRTWCLPADLGEALTYSRLRRNRTFILKPDSGSQGRGIIVTKTLKEIRPCDKGICQVYINKPFLIDGYKFDLRIYTLITSCDPLRLYIYDEGLVRFATTRYKEPNPVNISNVFMHLTNYAVNKYSRTYNQNAEEGSKRKLTWFYNYMKKLGYDSDNLCKQIDDVIVKTTISAIPVLKHSYAACFPNHDIIPACCELLGVDIILDKRLNAQILEVNHSPSFHTDTALDWEVKEALLSDMFRMINLEACNKRKIMRDDRRRIRERLLHGKDYQQNNAINFDEYYKYEYANRGSFRLVYPQSATKHQYNKYFEQTQASLYSETAASRAREAAQNALRDEMQLKARLEASKRIALTPQKPSPRKMETSFSSSNCTLASNASYLEPQVIIESEEKARLQKLAEREYLIKSHGVIEHVYFFMKKHGILRPRDQKKFAIFDKKHTDDVAKCNGVAISDFVESIKTKFQ